MTRLRSDVVFTATAPSNIAFVKYWGKADAARQIPANDSLSMTLARAVSETKVALAEDADRFYFEGKLLAASNLFAQKALRHVQRVKDHFDFKGFLNVASHNNFPAGCGIASSASGFAALTLAVAGVATASPSLAELDALVGRDVVADLARQGSGSSCRSMFGGFVHWSVDGDVCSFADDEHWALADVVAVIDDSVKTVSSSEGHQRALSSPLHSLRVAGIPERIAKVKQAIQDKDLAILGALIEQETMDMLGVMVSSSPPLVYYQQRTLDLLHWLRSRRSGGWLEAYFSLDAGPNPHLICEHHAVPDLMRQLHAAFPDLKFLVDHVGRGPVLACHEVGVYSRIEAHSPVKDLE